MHTVYRPDERRLACAGKSDYGDEFSLFYGEIYVLERFKAVGVFFAYVFELYHSYPLIPNEGGKPRPPSLTGENGIEKNQPALLRDWIISWAARSERCV